MDNDATSTVFVTGVTGFLGRHFVYWQRDQRLHFVVLVRAADTAEGMARFLDAIKVACESYRTPFHAREWSARTTIVIGDICQPLCGLSDDVLTQLRARGIAQFWHFAATLNFEEKSREKIWQQNIEGTSNVLQLVERVGIGQFIYCSTAYSVGKAIGMVEEVLHPLPRDFSNFYEESKCLAEHEVVGFCRAHGIKWAIIRPSIVIGPRPTKSSGGSTTGLYGFLRTFFKLQKTLQSIDHPLKIIGNPDTKLNLIPIDELMLDIRDYTRAGFENETIVHLSSNAYPSIGKAMQYIGDLLRIAPLRVAVRTAGMARSPVEKVIDRRTEFHSSYIDNNIEFRRALPRRYGVDNKEFAGFVTEAYREYQNEAPQSVFVMETMESFDGTALKVYTAGSPERPAVVLANAIGMPVEFWSRFAKQLAEEFYVLTWETRGCPNIELHCNLESHAFEHHVRDLVSILDRFNVAGAHVVGWCSGAQIALKAANGHSERIRTVVSLNGSFGLDSGIAMTPFEVKLREVMPRIATDKRMAEIYYNVVYGNRETSGIDAADLYEKNEQASTMLTSIDPALLHLTSRPFETVESLYRYSRLIAASLSENIQSWIGDVRVPVLLYTGNRDETAHPDCSRWIAARLPHASLLVDDDGDHFTFYREESVLGEVNRFLERARAGVVA